MRDDLEVAKEINNLSDNAIFGEVALLTEEPRSATVTVTSSTAKCLRLKKQRFNELVETSKRLLADSRALIGQNVLDMVPIFKSLSTMDKAKLLQCMTHVVFIPSTYICKQGTTGNTFYIITEGNCRVTLDRDGKKDLEVAVLYPGKF